MEFLRSFLRLHWTGKPVVASQNVGCLLRLINALRDNVYVSLIHVAQQIRLFLCCKKNLEEIRGYFYLPRQACSSASDVTPSCGVTPGKFIQSEVSIHAPFNNLICCKTVW